MEPTVKTGSIVVVKPSLEYKVGDIITFGKDDKKNIPTSHRINAIRMVQGKMFYTTKGDANNVPDAKEISQKEIIGKVIFKLPYLGYVLDMAKKPIGFILLVAIPALAIIYDEVVAESVTNSFQPSLEATASQASSSSQSSSSEQNSSEAVAENKAIIRENSNSGPQIVSGESPITE